MHGQWLDGDFTRLCLSYHFSKILHVRKKCILTLTSFILARTLFVPCSDRLYLTWYAHSECGIVYKQIFLLLWAPKIINILILIITWFVLVQLNILTMILSHSTVRLTNVPKYLLGNQRALFTCAPFSHSLHSELDILGLDFKTFTLSFSIQVT